VAALLLLLLTLAALVAAGLAGCPCLLTGCEGRPGGRRRVVCRHCGTPAGRRRPLSARAALLDLDRLTGR